MASTKSKTISARIDPTVKRRAEQVFKKLGLTASQAITLFYRQVQLRQGLPFPVELPNETTEDAVREARQREKLARFDSTAELYEDLEI